MNDNTIIYSLAVLFLLLGIVVPLISAEFGEDATSNDVDGVSTALSEEITSVSAFSVLLSVLGMFTWTFGSLPTIIDVVVMLPLRIMFWFIIIRKLPVVGSG